MARLLATEPGGERVSTVEGEIAMRVRKVLWLAVVSLIACVQVRADDTPAIPRPQIPATIFPIDQFGAVPDGKTNCTVAIRAAIDACQKSGGGIVKVPEGRWLTG